LGLEELLATEGLGVRVEPEENGLVGQRVLLLGERPLLGGLSGGTDDGLDLVRVDQAGDVGRGDLGGREVESGLGGVDVVKSCDGSLGPDDETTDVTTWSELKEVEGLNGAGLDSRDVTEGLDETFVVVVDDERTTPLPVTPVPHLSLSGAELARVGDLDDVVVGLDGLEELYGGLGLGDGLGGVGDDERNLLDLLDPVSTGEDEGWESRGSEGRSDSVTLLVLVDLV
jgi:hypothetical protein